MSDKNQDNDIFVDFQEEIKFFFNEKIFKMQEKKNYFYDKFFFSYFIIYTQEKNYKIEKFIS